MRVKRGEDQDAPSVAHVRLDPLYLIHMRSPCARSLLAFSNLALWSCCVPFMLISKQCVESEELFDFLRDTVNAAPTQAPKRARVGSASHARKAKQPAGSSASAPGTASGSVDGGGGLPSVAFAGDHRPLADMDDDYDADE
jgi:hypothetical protein